MKTKPIDIRSSSMDKIMACPQAVLNDTLPRYQSDVGDAARIGTTVHKLLADRIKTGEEVDARSVILAECMDEHEDEILRLFGYGASVWENDIGGYFENGQVEAAVQSEPWTVDGQAFSLSGTIDVVGETPEGLVFADWKTGRVDAGYQQQMNAYAWLLWQFSGMPSGISITGCLVFLRQGYVRIVRYTEEMMRDWKDSLDRNVLSAKSRMVFRPGSTCAYCSLAASCKARRELAVSTVQAILGEGDWYRDAVDALSEITEDTRDLMNVQSLVDELLYRLEIINTASDQARAVLRDAVERVGFLPCGDDQVLAIRPIERKALLPDKAMKVLRTYLSDAEILEGMKLSLPALLDVYSKSRNRGERKAAKEQLMLALDRARAITRTESARMDRMPRDRAEKLYPTQEGEPDALSDDDVVGRETEGESPSNAPDIPDGAD